MAEGIDDAYPHRRSPSLRLLVGACSAGPEDSQAFALGGLGLLVVQGDEFESGRIPASHDQSGADLKGIRGSERMRLDEAPGRGGAVRAAVV